MSRAELLGTAILLWTGSALLAAFLLLHPRASGLTAAIGTWRAWGGVVGLGTLGAAVVGRYPGLWTFPAGLFALLVLPAGSLRSLGPFLVAGALLLGVGDFWIRTVFPRRRACRRGRHARRSLEKGGGRPCTFPGRRALPCRSRGVSRFRKDARTVRDGRTGPSEAAETVPVQVEGAPET